MEHVRTLFALRPEPVATLVPYDDGLTRRKSRRRLADLVLVRDSVNSVYPRRDRCCMADGNRTVARTATVLETWMSSAVKALFDPALFTGGCGPCDGQ